MKGRSLRAALLLLLGAVVGLAVGQSPSWGSCLPPPPFEESLAKTDLVFVGTAVDVGNGSRWATFTVEEIWKGDPGGARVEVRGAERDAVTSIDRTYRRGGRYLVFAMRSGGAWQDNSCSATQPYGEEVQRLRPESVRPAKPGPAPEEGGGVKAGTVVFGAVLLVLVGGGFLVVRRWGRNDGAAP
jgi:hypothetical protein